MRARHQITLVRDDGDRPLLHWGRLGVVGEPDVLQDDIVQATLLKLQEANNDQGMSTIQMHCARIQWE